MIQGLRTALYVTPDLELGKQWYGKVFGVQPYFDEPYYVGFSIGGFELGLIPDAEPGTKLAHVYWGCEDITVELLRLRDLNVEIHEEVSDVGGGIRVASLRDPFGNIVGLIENPHFRLSEVR